MFDSGCNFTIHKSLRLFTRGCFECSPSHREVSPSLLFSSFPFHYLYAGWGTSEIYFMFEGFKEFTHKVTTDVFSRRIGDIYTSSM